MRTPLALLFALMLLLPATLVRAGEPACDRHIKRIALVQFPVLHSPHFADLPNLHQEYPAELLLRLGVDAEFLTASALQYGLFSSPEEALALDPFKVQDLVVRIAKAVHAQFLVAGVIVDGKMGNAIPLPSLFPAMERRVEVKLMIFDGHTGALISEFQDWDATHGLKLDAEGETFGSSTFFSSPFGAAVNRLLERQVAVIRDHIACVPLQADVMRVEEQQVTVDAGSLAGVRVGDTFTAYRVELPNVLEQASQRALGNAEQRVARVRITRVFPLSAIGEVDHELPDTLLAPGDVVRAF